MPGVWKSWVWKGCSKCRTTDPAQFNKKARAKSGFQSLCRVCHVKSPEADQSRRWRLKKYKMSPEAYALRLAEQGGVCAMCHKPPTGRYLSVDHDHACCPGKESCGKCIRGLLHFECNTLLGIAKDSMERLEQAAQYLRNATLQPI
jgi:hypothetical protein